MFSLFEAKSNYVQKMNQPLTSPFTAKTKWHPKHPILSYNDQKHWSADFTKPDFVDRLLSSKGHKREAHFSPNLLIDFIETITAKFDETARSLEALRQRCIRKAVAFCTQENREYEIGALIMEMKKAYAKLLNGKPSPLIIKIFTRLYVEYQRLSQQERLFSPAETVTDFIGLIAPKIEDINKMCSELIKDNSFFLDLIETKDIRRSERPGSEYVVKREARLPVQRLICESKSELIKLGGQDHLVLLTTKKDTNNFPKLDQLEMLNLHTGKLSPRPLLLLRSRKYDQVASFQVVGSSNCLIYPNQIEQALYLCKISSKKASLIAKVPLKNHILVSGKPIVVVLVEAPNLLVIGLGYNLLLFDVLGRKILARYYSPDSCWNVKFMAYTKGQHLVGVIYSFQSRYIAQIYRLSVHKSTLSLMHTILLDGFLDNLNSSDSALIFLELTAFKFTLNRIRVKFGTVAHDSLDASSYRQSFNDSLENLGGWAACQELSECSTMLSIIVSQIKNNELNEAKLAQEVLRLRLYEDEERQVDLDLKDRSFIVRCLKN